MAFTETDQENIFRLLSSGFEDIARHYMSREHMFDISSAVWEGPNQFIYQFPEVDRIFHFERTGSAWTIREVWLADSPEMFAIDQANGGRVLFDFRSPDVAGHVIRVSAAL
ncbi:hypothetical protein P0D71_00675 [Paraburkholderia sp. RL17-383-BIF-A]|uniref:hypothetical protein n=1 Tax=Paraburkholderia sp. RL17-383-BIF-A TaxID=3031631 RepID=UPI0038B9A3DA